jgi:hypothetical protein
MKRFRFHWINGGTSEGDGEDVAQAFTLLGYGGGAYKALAYWERVDLEVLKPEEPSTAVVPHVLRGGE